MQKARSHPFPLRGIGLLPLVSAWFQVLFTPLEGVLFTFQSPYWFTIGRWRVLSLGWWATRFHTAFHESSATLERPRTDASFTYGAVTLFGRPSQSVLLVLSIHIGRPQPRTEVRFGLVRLRSPLLTESRI